MVDIAVALSGTYNFSPSLGETTIYALNLCGIRATSITQEIMESARMAANMVLMDWSNKGVNLWTIEQGSQVLTTGTQDYDLPIDTIDLLDALKSGKVGYLGLDVYEYEKGLFFEDHEDDMVKDHLLQRLMQYPNVVVTPHQAYLTKESLQEIADETIKNLDLWQQGKCAGENCVCGKNCKEHSEKQKSHH
jgi:hypothetical protein